MWHALVKANIFAAELLQNAQSAVVKGFRAGSDRSPDLKEQSTRM